MDLALAIDIAAKVSAPTDRIVRPKALLSAGVSRGMVDRLIEIHHLRRALHGLYLVGDTHLSQRQLHRLALMRAGRRGGLSAQSGLELRDVLWPRIGLATALTMNRHAAGEYLTFLPMAASDEPGRIRLRRLDEPETMEEVGGLRVARVGRALTDLVAFGAGWLLEIAWSQAEFRGLLDGDELRADVGSAQRLGAPEVSALLSTRNILTNPDTDLRSQKELPWLHLMIDAGIPAPLVNAPVEAGGTTYFADYLWIEYGMAAELDSPDHLTAVAAAADRARDDEFDSVGIHTLRLIDSLALADPEPHLDRVKAALRRRGWRG